MNARAGNEPQHVRRRPHADKRLLMAVPMEPDISVHLPESVRADASVLRLAHQELVEEQAVHGEPLSVGPHLLRDQIRILVPERKDAGRLDADERSILGDDVHVEDKMPTEYKCNCSRERVTKALISVGRKEIENMINDGEPINMHCEFCNTDYKFSIEELKELLA